MKYTKTGLAIAGLLSTVLWAAPSIAADFSAGSEGSGETSRALPSGEEFTFRDATPVAPLPAGEASRGLDLDEETVVKSFTAVGKSSDGKEVRIEPSDSVKKAIKGDLNPADRGGIEGESVDPLTKAEDASRQVFGNDDRVQVTNTKVYPYNVIGYLEMKNQEGEIGMCTGTLIGPSTVLTAAHCVYDHTKGGFVDEILFVPGLAGPDNAPFGAYAYDTVYINQGYIDNYQGQYDGSIIPYDMSVITLQDPIGDALGWLGYYAYPDLANFEANIAGYQSDKPPFTLWRTRCDVLSERVYDNVFSYDCDVVPGSSGSAVYAYDSSVKQRVIVGVNVASSPEIMNQAVRLTATNVEWINSLNK
ncbi:MAG: serine protease [Rhizobiaceae bacterium]|nr:serine protease [Rhizobiaceae bacterium]